MPTCAQYNHEDVIEASQPQQSKSRMFSSAIQRFGDLRLPRHLTLGSHARADTFGFALPNPRPLRVSKAGRDLLRGRASYSSTPTPQVAASALRADDLSPFGTGRGKARATLIRSCARVDWTYRLDVTLGLDLIL
jgi:hypothetical protein